MFQQIAWRDKANVRRQKTVKGEHFEKNGLVPIYENIPCHLSENSLTNAYERNKVKTVDYDFKLFCDPKYEIQLNDIIEVKTEKGQTFKLYAGRSRRYKMTCQTACFFNPVAVEVSK